MNQPWCSFEVMRQKKEGNFRFYMGEARTQPNENFQIKRNILIMKESLQLSWSPVTGGGDDRLNKCQVQIKWGGNKAERVDVNQHQLSVALQSEISKHETRIVFYVHKDKCQVSWKKTLIWYRIYDPNNKPNIDNVMPWPHHWTPIHWIQATLLLQNIAGSHVVGKDVFRDQSLQPFE